MRRKDEVQTENDIEFRESLPKTISGKIIRNQL